MSKRGRNTVSLDELDEDEDVIRMSKRNRNRNWINDDSDDGLEPNKTNDDDGTNGNAVEIPAPGDHDVEETIRTENLRQNYRINTSNKTKSMHPIWEMFGKLERMDGRAIVKFKERVFCTHCFEKNKLKE